MPFPTRRIEDPLPDSSHDGRCAPASPIVTSQTADAGEDVTATERGDGFVRCPICSYILPPGSVIGGCTCGHAFWDGEGANPHIPPCAEARERPCLHADVADGGCALRATADSPPPTAVQLRECVLRIRALEAALTVVTVTDSLDQARGIAHAALNREEYHGEVTDDA